MSIIIGLVGTKGVGKDTVADILGEMWGFENVKFAAPLKAMLRAYLATIGVHESTIDAMIEGELKETPCPELGGRSPRHAMVTLGTEWGRDMMSPTLWIDACRARLSTESRAVVTDVRFQNEAGMIQDAGGVLWRITRPGYGAEDGSHVSETEQEGIHAACVLRNDGTLVDLERQVRDFAAYFGLL